LLASADDRAAVSIDVTGFTPMTAQRAREGPAVLAMQPGHGCALRVSLSQPFPQYLSGEFEMNCGFRGTAVSIEQV
jgi:hypothetical protein